ncbi:MAG: rod shape-determining protein MreD [Gammaproteobacteria bacterium]|nr:rod shape-determining protein MreD [Gammaproteobacteria bacterium]
MSGFGPVLAYLTSLAVALILRLIALPEALAALRPLWLPMVLAYWALNAPERPNLLAALLLGLICDALSDSALGAHALAFLLVAYASARLRPTLALVPWWQATLALAPVWAGYAAVMTGLDALAHHPAEAVLRWLPVAVTTAAWPLVCRLLQRLAATEQMN